jgi:23S rRNA pseudouridine1911/1915/1917 synthase
MNPSKTVSAEIPEAMGGRRLDQALAALFPDFSRTRLQRWIRNGKILVDGRTMRPKDLIAGGERITMDADAEPVTRCEAQDIPLEIHYEDDSLLIVNKPAGLVIHPAAGNRDGTLQNALLHYDPDLVRLPRAGIVHRLDKETSGLLMVARTLPAHKSLVEQLQARTVDREYVAVVQGTMTSGGTVDAPIGRHPVDRKRFAVRQPWRAPYGRPSGGQIRSSRICAVRNKPDRNQSPGQTGHAEAMGSTAAVHRTAKPAVTHYRVLERLPHHTVLRVTLETGRTHQIRVHMAYIGYPLVGDPVYGGRMRIPPGHDETLAAALRGFRRQALHAAKLALRHPETGELCQWHVEPPAGMQDLLAVLRRSAAENRA